MKVENLSHTQKELNSINDILEKMKYLLEENERIEKEWNDPTKWWNR
jgi:K+/H+ antiporter YhaU regulatory subunit KhtT